MTPDESTSPGETVNLADSRLLIEAARRLARRRHRQDGVLAAAVVVVVLTIALASSGVFNRGTSVAFTGPVPVFKVPGLAGVGPCRYATVWIGPGPYNSPGFIVAPPAKLNGPPVTVCATVRSVKASRRIRVWRIGP